MSGPVCAGMTDGVFGCANKNNPPLEKLPYFSSGIGTSLTKGTKTHNRGTSAPFGPIHFSFALSCGTFSSLTVSSAASSSVLRPLLHRRFSWSYRYTLVVGIKYSVRKLQLLTPPFIPVVAAPAGTCLPAPKALLQYYESEPNCHYMWVFIQHILHISLKQLIECNNSLNFKLLFFFRERAVAHRHSRLMSQLCTAFR